MKNMTKTFMVLKVIFRKFSFVDKKAKPLNRHFENAKRTSKDKFRTKNEIEKEITENFIISEKEIAEEIKILPKIEKLEENKETTENAHSSEKPIDYSQFDEKEIDPKEKYKAFRYNFNDEESKRRFEDIEEYKKFKKVVTMNHDSVFKIKNFFVRRNFLKRKTKEKSEEEKNENSPSPQLSEEEKINALSKLVDLSKDKILLYETNSNIMEMVSKDRKFIFFSLFTTIMNNLWTCFSFNYLFEKTMTAYILTYISNTSIFFLFIFHKKMVNDCVLQAEFLPKTQEILILRKKVFSNKTFEEKVKAEDLKYFKSLRVYEKSSFCFENVKNGNKYAFHENGIWHQEKAFDLIFGINRINNISTEV